MCGLLGQIRPFLCVVCRDRYVHFYVWFVGTDTSISMCGLSGQIRPFLRVVCWDRYGRIPRGRVSSESEKDDTEAVSMEPPGFTTF